MVSNEQKSEILKTWEISTEAMVHHSFGYDSDFFINLFTMTDLPILIV